MKQTRKCYECIHDDCTGCKMTDCCDHEDNDAIVGMAITCQDRFTDQKQPFGKPRKEG